MMKKSLSLIVIACFFSTTLTPYPQAHADSILNLPTPGTMVNLSPAYQPVIIKGLTVHKDNPFLFDFIVDVGQDNMSGAPLKKEGEKLIKYFLASLAVPDKDVWVNLSPYEKQRMVPEALGQTDMGKDLLEQDYILKQITASLIYPEKRLGKNFWDKVYAKAQQMYGTTQVPVNTFNKVWILADRAEVFEHNQTAFVVDSHLKVMLEEDYLALQKHADIGATSTKAAVNTIGSQIVRSIILPELEKEVNTGKNFANLRQILNSLILANWYKKNLKEALLNQVYTNQNKVKGINLNDPTVKQQIFEQYLKAYKKGVFNYIKEDVTAQGDTIPRKYFSGGFGEAARVVNPAMTTDEAVLANSLPDRAMVDINAGLLTEPFFGAKNVVTPDNTDKALLAVNRLLEISIRASQRLVESGLRGSYGEVEAILKDDTLNPVQRLDAVRSLFSKFHSITGLNDFQKVVDALVPLTSSDAIDSKMKALILGAIKDGADVYARDVFIASIKESGYIYIARLSEGKGRDEVPAIEAGQVIAPDELSGSSVIAAIQEADKRGESVFTRGGKTYPIVHGIVDVIEGTNAYATLSYAETPEMLAGISPSVSGAMHFSVVGQAVNKIGNLPDSYGAGIATNVGPQHVQDFYDRKVTVDGEEFSIADIELYARHPEQIRALLDFLAYTRGQFLGELKERVVLMARGREDALLNELEHLKATEIPGLEIVRIPDGTVIPALQAMIPVEMVAKLAGRPVEDILPSMFIGIAGGPEMQSKLAIAAGLQQLGAVASARTFDNNVGKSKPDADGKRTELGNYGNRYEFGSKAQAEMRRLRADRGDADQILKGNKLVLARDLPQDAVGIFPVLSNTATFGGIAGATGTSVNTLVIDAQEGYEPNIYIKPIKFTTDFSNGSSDAAMSLQELEKDMSTLEDRIKSVGQQLSTTTDPTGDILRQEVGFLQMEKIRLEGKIREARAGADAAMIGTSLLEKFSGLLRRTAVTTIRVSPATITINGHTYSAREVSDLLYGLWDKLALDMDNFRVKTVDSGKDIVLDYNNLPEGYDTSRNNKILADLGGLFAERYAKDWGFEISKRGQQWLINPSSTLAYLKWLEDGKEGIEINGVQSILPVEDIGGIHINPLSVEVRRGSRTSSMGAHDLDLAIKRLLYNLENIHLTNPKHTRMVFSWDNSYGSGQNAFNALAEIISQEGFGTIDQHGQLIIPINALHRSLALLNKLDQHMHTLHRAPAVFYPDSAMVVFTYKAKSWDTLYAIASRSGITEEQLARDNNLPLKTKLRDGQEIVIRTDAKQFTYVVQKGDNMPSVSAKMGITADQLANTNNLKIDEGLVPSERLQIIRPDEAMKSEDLRTSAFSQEEAPEGLESVKGIGAITSMLDKVAVSHGIVVIKNPNQPGYSVIPNNQAKIFLNDNPSTILYFPKGKTITKVYLDAAMTHGVLPLNKSYRRRIQQNLIPVDSLMPMLVNATRHHLDANVIFLSDAIRRRARLDRQAERRADRASIVRPVNGGIDLNTSNGMQWKVTKDGNGVEMNIDPAMIARIRREGIDSLSPVIFKMTPVVSVWPLVGLQAPAEQRSVVGV